jgi:glycosylphosphatidylinositol transamidase (GPIT) subunit GPI8
MICLYPLLSTIYCAATYTHIYIFKIISHPAVAFPDKPLLRFFPVASAEKWAVIAAGSSGFWNYRHQAEMMGCIAIVSD